MQDMR